MSLRVRKKGVTSSGLVAVCFTTSKSFGSIPMKVVLERKPPKVASTAFI